MVRTALLLCTLLLILGCGDSHTQDDAGFSRMEIHYTREGGWTGTTKLDIYGDGVACAYVPGPGQGDTLRAGSTTLSTRKRRELALMFRGFSEYESYYEPDEVITDQDYHTTILVDDGVADTVTVYMPEQADIPEGLAAIIRELASLMDGLLD